MQHKTITDLSRETALYILDRLKEMPATDNTGADKIFHGLYFGGFMVCIDKDNFCIYKITNEVCHIYAIYTPKQLTGYEEEFIGFLKENGVTKITALSALPEDKFIKSTGMSKTYSAYEREL